MPQQSTGEPSPKKHAIEDGIRSVVEMDREFDEHRTVTDRIAYTIGTFRGSMAFVGIHVLWFSLWFLINTGYSGSFRSLIRSRSFSWP